MLFIVIFLLSLPLFGSELEVDGDLNVTGNIHSQTIDSLQQKIMDLENQIAILQSTGVSIYPKVYQLTFEGEHNQSIPVDIAQITGVESSWYKIEVIYYDTQTISGSASHSARLSPQDNNLVDYSYGGCSITTGNGGQWYIVDSCLPIYINDENTNVYYTHYGWGGNFAATTLTVLITTEY